MEVEKEEFIAISSTVQLEARTYEPGSASSSKGSDSTSHPAGLAVIAHPYGTLGGCFDDHVVCSVATFLRSKHHLRVITFNSRGVGASSGKASWTGSVECDDYQKVVEWGMQGFKLDFPASRNAALVLCGYSAGSLYCSTARIESNPGQGSIWTSTPVYVLISYPRGVVWALSLFQSRRYEEALKRLTTEGSRARVLMIYGTQDEFTSRKTYENWTASLKDLAGTSSTTSDPSHLNIQAVEGADHFWRSRRFLSELVQSIDAWLAAPL